jgi:hypothetical protein
MAKLVGLVALFAAGLLLAGALASTGVADVTTTETLPVTTTVEENDDGSRNDRGHDRRADDDARPDDPTTTSSSSSSSTPTWVWVLLGILATGIIACWCPLHRQTAAAKLDHPEAPAPPGSPGPP